jgi:acetoin utilization deacetylase AcuC-like enzyme
MLAFYADHFVLPLPDGHRFPMAKYAMLRNRVAAELPGVRMREAPSATDGELALAHAPAYIQSVADGSIDAARMREIGFPWSEAMVERSRRSAGATVAAFRAALFGSDGQGEGIAANMAGGTHHASADKGGGFCVFNDAAVAARLMQAEWHRRFGGATLRVAVIDLDVHQGNGTAAIFQNDASVFTLSIHGEKNFPFRKEVSDLDVNLPDGCTDEPYLQALEDALEQLDRRFNAQAVIYLAGADAHEADRLGRLKLSYTGMAQRDARVFHWCFERRLPCVLTMGGGYGADLATTVQVQVNTYQAALAHYGKWRSRPATNSR